MINYLIARALPRLSRRFYCTASEQWDPKVFSEAWKSVPFSEIFGVSAAVTSAPIFLLGTTFQKDEAFPLGANLTEVQQYAFILGGSILTGFIGSRVASRTVRTYAVADLKQYIHDSKLTAAITGFQIAASTSLWSSMLFLAMLAQFPYNLPQVYRDEIKREQALIEEGQFERTDEWKHQLRAGARVFFLQVLGGAFLAGVGAFTVGFITIPLGATLGLGTRFIFRRAVAKQSWKKF